MASRRNRLSHRSSQANASTPYQTPRRSPAAPAADETPSAQLFPSFSNMQIEVVTEQSSLSLSPTWLISETGDAYSFVVQRTGLSMDEFQVVVERREQHEGERGRTTRESQTSRASNQPFSSTPPFRSSTSFPFQTSNTPLRASLTIFCDRGAGRFSPFLLSPSHPNAPHVLHVPAESLWRFARRFLLPADASPEHATAAHVLDTLTVTVPRVGRFLGSFIPRELRWGSWHMPVVAGALPCSEEREGSADGSQDEGMSDVAGCAGDGRGVHNHDCTCGEAGCPSCAAAMAAEARGGRGTGSISRCSSSCSNSNGSSAGSGVGYSNGSFNCGSTSSSSSSFALLRSSHGEGGGRSSGSMGSSSTFGSGSVSGSEWQRGRSPVSADSVTYAASGDKRGADGEQENVGMEF